MTQAEITRPPAQTDLDELREVVAMLVEAGVMSFKVRKTPGGTWAIEATKGTAAQQAQPLWVPTRGSR